MKLAGLFLLATLPATGSDAWERIASAFRPPDALTNDLGEYRSPLVFADGKKVISAEDWANRRKEIVQAWTRFLGPWPSLIEKPRIEWLSQTNRDNFVQHRVRVEVARGLMIEGYLLIPVGKGPFPA